MIDLYSGTPGSGKSLHTANRIVWALRLKRPVIANFEIQPTKLIKNFDLFTYKDNSEITPAFLVQYSMERRKKLKLHHLPEDSILLIIDECQLMFNSRDSIIKSADGGVPRKDWVKFFTQHRKYGYHIILVAQFDRMIDRQIRSLIEYEFIHRKLSNFGWRGYLLALFFLRPANFLFMYVQMWYPLKQKISSEFFAYSHSLSKIYDSYGDFEEATQVKREPNKEKGVWGLPRSASARFNVKYSDKLYLAFLCTRKKIKYGSPLFYNFRFV